MTDLISSRDPRRPWKVFDPGIAAAAERRQVTVRSTGVVGTLTKWPPNGAQAKVVIGGRHYSFPKADIEGVS